MRIWTVALLETGKSAEALAQSEELIRVAQDAGDPYMLCWGLTERGRVLRSQGQWSDARAALTEGLELAIAHDNHYVRMEAGGLLGQLYASEGEQERAFDVLRETRRLCAERHLQTVKATPLLNGWAEVHLLAAERAIGIERAKWIWKAGRTCREALKHGQAFQGGLPESMRLQGTYECLRGRHAAARKWWQQSLDLAEKMGQRYDVGMTQLEMGRLLGERAHLERAESIFTDLGAEWYAARAKEALGSITGGRRA